MALRFAEDFHSKCQHTRGLDNKQKNSGPDWQRLTLPQTDPRSHKELASHDSATKNLSSDDGRSL